ncbi:MAG: hypothetical protein U0Q11_01570 [Vicinamibacterales bacterium]
MSHRDWLRAGLSLMFCGLSLASFAQDVAPASTATGSSASAQLPAPASMPVPPVKPRATGRVSVFTDSWWMSPDIGTAQRFGQVISSASFHAADTDENGVDYGIDTRFSGLAGHTRPNSLSLYEGYAGIRALDGTLRVRAGNVWLNELGALGSLAGAVAEVRSVPDSAQQLRWRLGVFGGLEPKILDFGYYSGVKKYGAYSALDGENGRRHTIGYVNLEDHSLVERSVVSASNFIPVRRVFFLYQALEYDVAAPAGQARPGLSYLYSNARYNATSRVELQGTYNRGRSLDTRGLADDVLNGRPINQTTLDGLAYESLGGRVTIEPVVRVRVYAGYSQDKTNRDDRPAGRLTVGGYASNVAHTGFDLSGSYWRIDRSNLGYHSEYVSLGRQIGRRAYLSGDYTTSLSIVRFVRSSDGILIEEHPRTKRLSGTGSINVGATTTLQFTIDRMWDVGVREFRLLFGITRRL